MVFFPYPSHIHWINLQIMAEILAAEHMFAFRLEHREKYLLHITVSTLLCLAAAFLFPVPDQDGLFRIGYGMLMYLTIFLISGAGIFSCYQEDIWSILFCCMTGYTVHQLASALESFCSCLADTLSFHLPYLVTYLVTALTAYLGSYFVFSKGIQRSKGIHVDNRRLLLLSFTVPLIEVLAGLVQGVLTVSDPHPGYDLLIYLYNAAACIFILCVQFGLLSNRALELDLSVASQMLEENRKQYQVSKESIDIINQKCHDLKHQIRSIRTGSNSIDQSVLKEIEQAVGIYDSVVHTGSEPLDIILTEKSLICEKNGITLTCMAEGGKIRFMASSDIYALFGNAMDNAISAVLKLDDSEQRTIALNVKAQSQMISIHVENRFSGTLRFDDGLPLTTQSDTNYHGFGMKSMRMIAEKYNGFMTTSVKGQVFHLNIVIPIPQ